MMLTTTSCSDFLEYKDKDKIEPTTLSHYSDLAYTELMQKENSFELYYLNVMTDDLESSVIPSRPGLSDTDTRLNFGNYFLWAVNPQIQLDDKKQEDLTWACAYKRILMCNIIEEKVREFEDDKDGVKNRLIGETKFIRALFYYYLMNLYGEPYQSEQQAKTGLAVPINKETGINTIMYKRSTLEDVCSLIENDLKDAIVYLSKGEQKATIFRPRADVARLLLSRLYIYKKEWQKAIDICNELINITSSSITTRDILTKIGTTTGILSYRNPAVLYTYGAMTIDFSYSATETSGRAFFITSNSLLSLYEAGDLRKANFFISQEGLSYLTNKITRSRTREAKNVSFRLDEAYYNRAEAYIELGEIQKGLDDLNFIRKDRFPLNANYRLMSSTQEDARQKMHDEKRREFCFEGLRWFDIRRWNLGVTHLYQDFGDPNIVTTYELKPGSPNYIMPLPLDVAAKNDKIEKFTRIETLVR